METTLFKAVKCVSDYNFLFAYPAKEEFALSSLGYMWLLKTVTEAQIVNTEMVTTDYPHSPYKNLDSMSFSISFDFDFMGVFKILDANNIPFLSKERNGYPLIFAGGPVITTNPEPYKDIFDFMLLGDGETVILKVLEILRLKEEKEKTLQLLSKIDGVYVPYISDKVKKITEPLNNVIYTPVISDKSYFKDTFIIEVQRGCMNRCAFCTASYLNLPFRNYDYEKITEAIEKGLEYTNKIALLGAQISAHPQFEDIMRYIRAKIESGINIELGISSLRTDTVTPELIKTLVLGGQKTSTIAIEAASERLRKFINKNLTENQIIDAVNIARENGLKGLKIYSMIGIPTETDDDIREFIRLANILKSKNKGFDITFSFSSFVPKPQTPLQWSKREDSKSLEKKQKFLSKELSKIGIDSKFSSIKWDYWQTLLSRGGSDLGEFLIEVYKNGGGNSAYKSALKKLKNNYEKAINGYSFEEIQPWDFIENYVSKERLLNEYRRLIS